MTDTTKKFTCREVDFNFVEHFNIKQNTEAVIREGKPIKSKTFSSWPIILKSGELMLNLGVSLSSSKKYNYNIGKMNFHISVTVSSSPAWLLGGTMVIKNECGYRKLKEVEFTTNRLFTSSILCQTELFYRANQGQNFPNRLPDNIYLHPSTEPLIVIVSGLVIQPNLQFKINDPLLPLFEKQCLSMFRTKVQKNPVIVQEITDEPVFYPRYNQNILTEVLPLAKKLHSSQLHHICEEHLRASIDVENVCTLLVESHNCKHRELETACCLFIKENGEAVKKTNHWKLLPPGKKSLILSTLL